MVNESRMEIDATLFADSSAKLFSIALQFHLLQQESHWLYAKLLSK